MASTTQSYRIGLMVGHERGLLDRADNSRQPLDALWVPEGTGRAYLAGLHAGYLKGVTGEPLADEQMGR